MRIESATYKPAILPEHNGNPLIEALPAKMNDEGVLINLGNYPQCTSIERGLEAFERVEYLTRLKDLRQPLPIYIQCFRAIEFALKEGYSSKNPLIATTQNYLHYSDDNRPPVIPSSGAFIPKGSGTTVIGESGVGKTSMLEQILNYFPDVIQHHDYKGFPLNFKQIVWLKVDCPYDSSVRAFCHRLLIELDLKLGVPPTKPASTIPALLTQIESRIKSGFLGILVIDEMQNLNLAKAGGSDRLIGFIHNIVNSLGIPILFCANPPFNELLSETMKTARRAENNGYFEVKLMQNDLLWELFAKSLWELQWTDKETPFTKELSDRLFTLSVGNMDLAVRIYREAQRTVIGTHNERISIDALDYAAMNTIKATAPKVKEIQLKQQLEMLNATKEKSQLNTGKQAEPIKSDKNIIVETNNSLHSIPGDLTSPQHPEFAERLVQLQKAKSLNNLIRDPDLIQRASREIDPELILNDEGILCNNPLKMFSEL
jgi:hypothetical protein